MNIIVLNSKRGHSRTLPVPRHWPWLLAVALVVFPAIIGVSAYLLAYRVGGQPEFTPVMTERFAGQLEQQQQVLSQLDQQSQEQFRALTEPAKLKLLWVTLKSLSPICANLLNLKSLLVLM